jgi:phosphohistidine phosphatase
MRAVAEALSRGGVQFDRILHSPKLRAVQTAEVLAPLARGALASSPLLVAPPGAELLRALRGGSVAVVGHEPHVTALAAWLVLGHQDAASSFAFGRGAVALLSGEPRPGGMRLRLYATSKTLAAWA